MKKLLYTIAFLGAVALVLPSHAQVSIQINIGSQPQWGPSGYDYARYYYMPEYDMYYDVQRGYYVYWDYNRWVQASVLPVRYANVDLYRTYKVVLNGANPWLQHKNNRNKYYTYIGNRKQINIREYNNRNARYSNNGKSQVRSGVSGTTRVHDQSDRGHGRQVAQVKSANRSTNSSKIDDE
jgi:hypothetical protein